MVQKDLLVLVGLQESQTHLDLRVHQAHKGQLVLPDQVDQLEALGLADRPDLQAEQVQVVLLDLQVQQEFQILQDLADHPVQLVEPGLVDPLAHQAQLE